MSRTHTQIMGNKYTTRSTVFFLYRKVYRGRAIPHRFSMAAKNATWNPCERPLRPKNMEALTTCAILLHTAKASTPNTNQAVEIHASHSREEDASSDETSESEGDVIYIPKEHIDRVRRRKTLLTNEDLELGQRTQRNRESLPEEGGHVKMSRCYMYIN